MKKILIEALKFQKLPFSDLYFKENILLNLVMANKRNRMFKIEKPQISDDYIKNFEDFFIVIDTGMQNSFILLDKNDYLFLQNANGDTNICSKMILRYSIFPAIDEEVTSTAIIENKLFVSETLRIPLLEKEDIKSIIENRFAINL